MYMLSKYIKNFNFNIYMTCGKEVLNHFGNILLFSYLISEYTTSSVLVVS